MIVDFQLATTSLVALIQRTVEDRIPTLGGIGAPFYFSLTPPPAGTPTPPPPNHVVDHVRIDSVAIRPDTTVATELRNGAGTVLATVNRRRPLVEIIARAPLAPLAALEAAGTAAIAPGDLVDVRLRIRFALDVALVGGRVELSLTFTSVDLGLGILFLDRAALADLGVDATLIDTISTSLRAIEQRTAIDTSAITSMFSTGFTFWNAGITVAGGNVTIRLEYGASGSDTNPFTIASSVAGWGTFYSTGPRNHRGADAWGLFVSGDAFERLLEGRLRDAFAGMTDTTLMPDRPPHATWSLDGSGRPRVTAECGVTSVRACQPFGIDIHGTLRVGLGLSTPRPSILRLDLRYDVDPYWGEVIGCVALSTLAGAFAGFVIGGTFANIPGAIVGAIVGAVVGLVGSIVGLATRGGGGAPSLGGFTPVPGSANDFFSEQALVIPGGDVFGDLRFTTLGGFADGLVVGGGFGTIAVNRRARLAIDRVPSGFAWQVVGSCASWRTMGVADIGGRNEGDLPMAVYPPTILGPAGLGATGYADRASRIDRPRTAVAAGARLTVSTKVSNDGVEALQALSPPPAYKLLIATSGGARIISVPGVDASLTAAERDQLADNMNLSCSVRVLRDRMRQFRRWPFPRPGDWIDPVGPAEWVLRIAGLEQGDLIRVLDRKEQVLGVAEVDPRGVIDLRWFQMGGPGPESWEPVNGERRSLDAMLDSKVHVGAARASFARHGDLSLAAPVTHLALAHHRGVPHLVAVTKSGITVASLANPSKPMVVDERELHGVEGATLLEGNLVAWTGDQVWRAPVGADGHKAEELPRAALDKQLGGRRLSLASTDALVPRLKVAEGRPELMPLHLDELSAALDAKRRTITVLGLEAVATG